MFAAVSLGANTPPSSRFSVNSSNHSGKSRNQFPDAGVMSLFLFVFWVSVGSRDQFPQMLVSSLRVVAGLDDISSDVSCGNDVEDVLALEPFCIGFSSIFCWNVVSDHWPTHMHEYPCSSESFPGDTTAGVSSRICTVTKSPWLWT